MKVQAVIKNLQVQSSFFRLGLSLDVTDDFVQTVGEILPYVVAKEEGSSSSITLILSKILVCQEAEDWLGLADYIDYELINLLKQISSN